MDSPLLWTLDDARFVTRDVYDEFTKDPNNKKLEKELKERGGMFQTSLSVVNEHCLDELATYRKAIVARESVERQEELLDNLYDAYVANMRKKPYAEAFDAVASWWWRLVGHRA